MTTQAGQEPSTPVQPVASDIEAEMIWTSTGSPPEVTLSFQGLAEPISLWQQLMALGWDVPQCPPRPGSAIEWVPDPVAGTDYTIMPWRVNEFRLREGQWTREQSAAIGDQTYQILRSFDTTVTGTQSQLTRLRSIEQSQSQIEAPAGSQPTSGTPTSEAVAPTTPVEPALQSPVVFLALSDETAARYGENLTSWVAVIGREKTQLRWSEVQPAAGIGVTELNDLVSASSGSWILNADLPTVAAGQVAFRMLVPGASADDSKLNKTVNKLGGMVRLRDLRPLTVGGEPAVLIFGAAPGHAYEMLHSNLRLRVPNGAARIET